MKLISTLHAMYMSDYNILDIKNQCHLSVLYYSHAASLSWENDSYSVGQKVPHPLIKFQGLLCCSQDPATGPYHEPDNKCKRVLIHLINNVGRYASCRKLIKLLKFYWCVLWQKEWVNWLTDCLIDWIDIWLTAWAVSSFCNFLRFPVNWTSFYSKDMQTSSTTGLVQ